MRTYSFTSTPAAASNTSIASGASSAGASVTITSFTSADGLARQIRLGDGTAHNQTTATYILTGTDADGNAQTESLAGPGSGSSTTSTKFFKTVTAVSITSPVAGSTINIGTNGVAVSPTHSLDPYSSSAAGASMTISGTINVDLQETRTNIFAAATSAANWISCANFTGKTASVTSTVGQGVSAIRLKINSFTTGGSVIMEVSPAREES